MSYDERTPLLRASSNGSVDEDLHAQFCRLIGTRPLDLPPKSQHQPHPESLYLRALAHRRNQNWTYMFTATLTNTLILSQVVLGATLTGLGASNSSHILVTIFGALNTVIAGLIAFLKSRGQPMRARMFRDDLERVVDEIENSAVMWFGISRGAHGYDAIDTDDQVTVRGEVARLTRLYDKAVKTNTLNDPDMYSSGAPGDLHSAALRDKSAVPAVVVTPAPAADAAATTTPGPVAVVPDSDAAPASQAPQPTKPAEEIPPPAKDTSSTATGSKDASTSAHENASDRVDVPDILKSSDAAPAANEARPTQTPAPTATSVVATPPINPDESPASSAFVGKHTQSTA